MDNKESRKQLLWQQLSDRGCMWSYAKQQHTIDNDLLIEKALLYLEFEEMDELRSLFPMNHIKRVWRERLVPQGEYYGIINWLLAAMFFGIKNPDKYLKRYEKSRLEAGIKD